MSSVKLANVPLKNIYLPWCLVRSIINNHPPNIRVEYQDQPKPRLRINNTFYTLFDNRRDRYMRGREICGDDYYQRGLDDIQFQHFLQQNPVQLIEYIPNHTHAHLLTKNMRLFTIKDGMHRIERAIYLGLSRIPALIFPNTELFPTI